MSQRDQILQYLRRGGRLTPGDALERFQCFRLAARIDELRRAGHAIAVDKVVLSSGKHVARYRMEHS